MQVLNSKRPSCGMRCVWKSGCEKYDEHMAKVGFIGLGVMGSRMAGHLIKNGHDVTVWNRTASRAEPLREQGAHVAQTVAQLAESSEFVCICVSKSEDVLELVSQFPKSMQGKTVVDHSTIAPQAAREIGSRLDCAFIDAPVTGGERGAVEGTLTIFCGGTQQDFKGRSRLWKRMAPKCGWSARKAAVS